VADNIYLIGMMGSGKSATGKELASFLGYEFADIDAEIEKKEKKTIPEIFAQSGEAYFRNVESLMLRSLSSRAGYVFATGGGIVLREENIQRMKATGKIILLTASAETLWQRLRYSKDRPLLNKPDPFGVLQQILSDRETIYQNACDVAVPTDGKLAEDVAQHILKLLGAKR